MLTRCVLCPQNPISLDTHHGELESSTLPRIDIRSISMLRLSLPEHPQFRIYRGPSIVIPHDAANFGTISDGLDELLNRDAGDILAVRELDRFLDGTSIEPAAAHL